MSKNSGSLRSFRYARKVSDLLGLARGLLLRGDVHENSLRKLSSECGHGLVLERNDAIGDRHEGVVARADDVRSGVELGAALTDQDVADLGDLASEEFDAEALCG